MNLCIRASFYLSIIPISLPRFINLDLYSEHVRNNFASAGIR